MTTEIGSTRPVLVARTDDKARAGEGLLFAPTAGEVKAPASAPRARRTGERRTAFIDPRCDWPDIRLLDRLGARVCLRERLLPWRMLGDETIVLLPQGAEPGRRAAWLAGVFGPVRFAHCEPQAIDAAILALRGDELRRMAETRTPLSDSCRALAARPWAAMLAALAFAGLAVLAPFALLAGLTLVALLAMLAGVALKALALVAALRHVPPSSAPPAIVARLPTVSIMVALLREADIAPRLVRRLGRLDYPRDKLDVLLVVEERDTLTRKALEASELPDWMRIVTVPHGTLRTKPRALNFALDLCRGSLIGIYDAEDAPEPGQIRRIVEHFHQRDARVACLQGVLDYYNPATNWIARCFTLEYATWFRVILPGLQRLGLPIPLGGTTLFFRRAALEALGAWDAHNVTEDADLGLRLHRRGYRTEIVPTVTREEANCHALPWVRQRSRWIKGYMMTWRVHMRDPHALWQDLGPRGFLGMQVLILGSVLHALLAPFLLSFWLVFAGLPHPLGDRLSQEAFLGLFGLFLVCEAISLTIGYIGLKRSGQPIHPVWMLAMSVYHPMASLAAIKALYEVLRKPFYWDKTRHGRHDRISGA